MTSSIPIIFHSLEAITDVFKKEEFSNLDAVKKLLAVYDETFLRYTKISNHEPKKHPFIVFEGLDATGKTTISRKIAEKHNAKLLRTPPASISGLRGFFDNDQLRVPYYSFGNYIAELEVLEALQQGPVVLDRYWHSTAVFWLSQSVEDGSVNSLPPKSDKIYTWPSDLLKPDMVIVLTTTEENRRKRIARRKVITNQEALLKSSVDFRKNIIKAYDNMSDPKVEFVDSNDSIEEVVCLVNERIKRLFD
ncbi:thymidylate kinase [Holotrichia oblita]|uniref:Thymidylate kinase n=1 Tax=Holotrichia oblita TaxID=644536 RepID=A0ACB9THM4_HOLOL|nr:thymidylate kinase [Holotrichia oblita]